MSALQTVSELILCCGSPQRLAQLGYFAFLRPALFVCKMGIMKVPAPALARLHGVPGAAVHWVLNEGCEAGAAGKVLAEHSLGPELHLQP